MRPGRIFASALARHVHASGLRHKATGRVRNAEMRYDRRFPKGACFIERRAAGGLRIISPDESECINVQESDEGRLFKYTDGKGERN